MDPGDFPQERAPTFIRLRGCELDIMLVNITWNSPVAYFDGKLQRNHESVSPFLGVNESFRTQDCSVCFR